MLERLRRLVAPPPLETTYDDAPEAFEEYHADALETARNDAETIRTDIATAVVDLESGLTALESFEDERDRVEDVVTHVATKRRAALENLSLSDDPAELSDAVETFLQDRSDLSRKEAAILRQIELPAEYREAVEAFKTNVERLDQYLTNEYERIQTLETLEELVAKRREQQERIADLEAEIAELEPESVETELEARRTELEDLHESDLREEYNELKDQLDTVETEREQVVSDIGSAAAECRRGLRKLIYAIENDELDIDTDLAVLKALRDSETEAILDRDPEHVVAVIETVEAEVPTGYLEESERSRLLDGFERMQELLEEGNPVEALDSERTALEEQIRTHEYQKRKRELLETIESLEAELTEIHSERDTLETRLSEARDTLTETEARIEEVLEEHVPGDVILEEEQ